MLVKNYKIFSIIQKILFGTGILVSLIFFVILLYQKNKSDGNIVFIVDISHSMNTKVGNSEKGEVKSEKGISRLDLGKKVIENIIKEDKNQHQFGVIIFSKQASYYVAPTFDTGTLLSFTKALQTNILPGGGSDLQPAINIFEATKNNDDIAVVITDGDDIEIGSGFDFNDNVIGVGVGSEKSGKVLYPDGTTMIDKKGKIIYSTINKDFIKKISKKGFFVEDLEDVKKVDLGNNLFINNNVLFKLYILISILIILGLKI